MKKSTKRAKINELKEAQKDDTSRILLLGVIVLLISLFLLVIFYGERLGLTAGVIFDQPSDFTFILNDRYNAIELNTEISDGMLDNFYILYTDQSGLIENRFVGTGRRAYDLLAVSDSDSMIIDEDIIGYFVVSWVSESNSESYVLRVGKIDESDPTKNTTTLASFAVGSSRGLNLDIGETDNIGQINLTLNSANQDLGVINLSISSGTGDVYFDRIYDLRGNYLALPSADEFPTAEYLFKIYGRGDAGSSFEMQNYRAYFYTNDVTIAALCYDSDGGEDYLTSGFVSKGEPYKNDVCIDGEILNESVCEDLVVGGSPMGIFPKHIGFNCSTIDMVCQDRACVTPTPPACVPNWTARNTSCVNNNLITYYVDSNGCQLNSGRPANATVQCGEIAGVRGLIGTADDIEEDNLGVRINIEGEEVDYGRNYSGDVREVIFEDEDTDRNVVRFDWDFTVPLDLRVISIETQRSSASRGYVIFNGVGIEKIIYVDKLDDDSESVCIKNSTIDSISEMSLLCDEDDETVVECPGSAGNYLCEIIGNRFRIGGVDHSAVREILEGDTTGDISSNCAPSWQCEPFGECIGGVRERLCYDVNYCGVTTGKPNETEYCDDSNYTGLTGPQRCIPRWECSAWTPEQCPDSKIQTRTCTDSNSCGTLSGRPLVSKTCVRKGIDLLFYVLIALLVAAIGVIAAIIIHMLMGAKPQTTEQTPPTTPSVRAEAPAVPGQQPFQSAQRQFK